MNLNLDGLELSAELIEQLNKQNAGLVNSSEIEGLKKNRDDLLAEKKAAQEAKLLAEGLAEEGRIAALTAKKDYESLYKSSQETIAGYKERDVANAAKLTAQAVSTKALEMAKTISDGDNADLLATFIEQRLRSDNGEIKVTDANGGLTISTQEDLLAEFKANQKFASLVTVTKAAGSSASSASKHNGSAINVDTTNPEAVRKAGIAERLAAQGINAKQ